MNPPALLFAIFAMVCGLFTYFPVPIRSELDVHMGRVALAAGVTLLIAAAWDFCIGFREGMLRKRGQRKP